ncbi:hypothetical protein EGW08_022666 [Elysia chlorotica]|uniref:Uncharacterized protein n=1 Tax=Elysia chlorotica TaxID=188477 RepID=A0A3S1AVQ2_ELYCH|nr:hypothetical protein EGW08_022666 [Elysia chlorotica]
MAFKAYRIIVHKKNTRVEINIRYFGGSLACVKIDKWLEEIIAEIPSIKEASAATQFTNLVQPVSKRFRKIPEGDREQFLTQAVDLDYISETISSLGITKKTFMFPPKEMSDPAVLFPLPAQALKRKYLKRTSSSRSFESFETRLSPKPKRLQEQNKLRMPNSDVSFEIRTVEDRGGTLRTERRFCGAANLSEAARLTKIFLKRVNQVTQQEGYSVEGRRSQRERYTLITQRIRPPPRREGTLRFDCQPDCLVAHENSGEQRFVSGSEIRRYLRPNRSSDSPQPQQPVRESVTPPLGSQRPRRDVRLFYPKLKTQPDSARWPPLMGRAPPSLDVGFLELREQAIRWEEDQESDRGREVVASHQVSTGNEANGSH